MRKKIIMHLLPQLTTETTNNQSQLTAHSTQQAVEHDHSALAHKNTKDSVDMISLTKIHKCHQQMIYGENDLNQ